MSTANYEEIELQKELARRKHAEFIKYCWIKPNEPFIIGYHTQIICDALDKALIDYNQGISTFKIITIPFQHGKSDAVSRYFPPRFLGLFPEKEILVVSHTADKAHSFSKFSRFIVTKSKKYQELFPYIHLAKDDRSVETWTLDNGIGKAQYYGLLSGIAGTRSDCTIVDDYCRNQEDADSPAIREKTWKEFVSGVITRRQHPCIFIMLATRWHIDDVIGRYIDNMNKPYSKYPKTEVINIPAMSNKYPTGVLFPELKPPSFYEEQKALLGQRGFMSLMQNDPLPDGGNMFDISGIKIIDEKDVPEHAQAITIDLASTEVDFDKKRNKIKNSSTFDPDYTVCLRGFMVYDQNLPKIYVTNLLRFRESAVKRNQKIKEFVLQFQDPIYMESFAAYKDTFNIIKDELMGTLSIRPLTLPGDKEIKAHPLVPIFEAGNIYIVRNSQWNQDFEIECRAFPSGKHDDIVDCLAMLYHIFKKKPRIYGRKVVY